MKNRSLLALALVLGSVACGSSQTTTLKTSPRAPASEAKVESDDGDNGNTKVTVEVKHMAPPESISENASTYVVWARPRNGDAKPQNIGAINIDGDRKGKLETITPLHKFDVFITAEPSSEVSAPTSQPILTGKVER